MNPSTTAPPSPPADSPSAPPPAPPKTDTSSHIELSTLTKTLVSNLKSIKKRHLLDENSRIQVSNTVSFFAIIYEKVRNAVEYREEHLIRRAAIERILKRRLLLNPEGRGEGENLVRELLWARYFPSGSLGLVDSDKVQRLIDKYIKLRKKLVVGQIAEKRVYYNDFLFDLLTCEIEESLDSFEASTNSLFSSYMFYILKDKIKVENMSKNDQDTLFYVAVEKGFAKSDRAYLRFHLFSLSHKILRDIPDTELDKFIAECPILFNRIDKIINNPSVERLTRYVRSQLPPFLILFTLLERTKAHAEGILSNKTKLWEQIDQICRERYQQTSSRLRNTAIRSLIYIFLTKMVFALILEFPLSQYLYNDVNMTSIAINSLFPPFLMLLIVGFAKIPGEENTKRIYDRVINVVDKDTSFEATVTYVVKPLKAKKPMLVFGFTIFYTLTFIITLGIIHAILQLLHFNPVSEIIFVFFVSVVSFFAYRVRQIAKEYKLQERDGFFSPFFDFFFMPILALGKFFSGGIARLNVFMVVLDFLIEAPFKLIFEVVEEWISFVRARKEEII